MLSFAHHMEFFVILGVVVGLAIIVSLVFIIKRLGKKLPLRVLFGLTMGVGAYMSIVFIGNTVESSGSRDRFNNSFDRNNPTFGHKFSHYDWDTSNA